MPVESRRATMVACGVAVGWATGKWLAGADLSLAESSLMISSNWLILVLGGRLVAWLRTL